MPPDANIRDDVPTVKTQCSGLEYPDFRYESMGNYRNNVFSEKEL